MFKKYFISGAHRSGTSWVGKMISASNNFYLRDEELFNCVSEIADFPFDNMYTHICKENEDLYKDFIINMVNNNYSMTRALKRMKSERDFFRILKRKGRSLIRKFNYNSPIFIEPIGLFSAEWFAKRFDSTNIIVIRHPASFISSLIKLNWSFDFSHFLNQEILMKKYLLNFKNEIINPPDKKNILETGILLWKCIYSVVSEYRKKFPDWIFVRHEDLANDPINEYKKLYNKLSLNFSDEAKNIIIEHTSPSNPIEFSGATDDSKRDSKNTIKIWKKRLKKNDVIKIYNEVKSVSNEFYSKESWK